MALAAEIRLIPLIFARKGGKEGWPALAKSLGPVGTKIGQHLALRPDLIDDPEVIDDFLRFTDQHDKDTIKFERVLENIKKDLQARKIDFAREFAWIDPEPIAAASLAQVYRGELVDGRSVVVKVKRSEIERQTEDAIRVLKRIAAEIDMLGKTPWIRARDHADEIEQWLNRELDYEHERTNLKRFQELLAASPTVHVPEVHTELSGKRFIVMEHLGGVTMTTLIRWIDEGRSVELRARGLDRDQLAGNLLESVLEQVFVHQFFHADTHPGNLLGLPENKIGFVDFGLVDALDPRFGRDMFRYLRAMYQNDTDDMLRSLKGMLLPTESADWSGFRERFLESNREWRRTTDPAARSPTGLYISSVLTAAGRTGHRIPPGILSMLRALHAADYIAYRLGSEDSLRVAGRRFFERFRWRAVTDLMDSEVMQGELLQIYDMVRDGPRKAYRVLSDLADEQLTLRVENTESPQTRKREDSRAQLMALAVVAVSLSLLLTVMLVVTDGSEGWLGGLSILILAALIIVYLAIAVVWRRLSR